MPSGTLNLTHVLSRELARSGWHAVQISNSESGSARGLWQRFDFETAVAGVRISGCSRWEAPRALTPPRTTACGPTSTC